MIPCVAKECDYFRKKMSMSAISVARSANRYQFRQLAYLTAQGAGLSGTYFIKGVWLIRGNSIEITAMGSTAAASLGKVTFFATASLLRNKSVLISEQLRLSGRELWPSDDGFVPIGSTLIGTPSLRSSDRFHLRIEAGYMFSNPEGTVTPIPPTASISASIDTPL